MTRRSLGVSIAGAFASLVSAFRLKGEAQERWLTIAHDGRNRNGRIYPEEVLRRMADHINGSGKIPVAKSDNETPMADSPLPLSALLGIVVAAKVEHGELAIRARFFTNKKPTGRFLTPSGVGSLLRDTIQGDYQLKWVSANQDSAFQRATRVV